MTCTTTDSLARAVRLACFTLCAGALALLPSAHAATFAGVEVPPPLAQAQTADRWSFLLWRAGHPEFQPAAAQ